MGNPRDASREPGLTHTHTHTHTADTVVHRSSEADEDQAACSDPVSRLRALGLRPSQARFVARFAALGFPDYKVLADHLGLTCASVISRMYRLRKRLGLSNQQQFVALIIEVVRDAGESRVTFPRIQTIRGQIRREEKWQVKQ
jgi:hypothetical protein